MLHLSSHPTGIHSLSLHGGNPVAGELVFNNQGACLQCHKINGEGGLQGPELAWLRSLKPRKIVGVSSIQVPKLPLAMAYPALPSIPEHLGGRLAAESKFW